MTDKNFTWILKERKKERNSLELDKNNQKSKIKLNEHLENTNHNRPFQIRTPLVLLSNSHIFPFFIYLVHLYLPSNPTRKANKTDQLEY